MTGQGTAQNNISDGKTTDETITGYDNMLKTLEDRWDGKITGGSRHVSRQDNSLEEETKDLLGAFSYWSRYCFLMIFFSTNSLGILDR